MELVLPNFLEKRAQISPAKMAIKTETSSITFEQLFTRSKELAYKIASFGIRKGDYVSIYMENSLNLMELIFALKNIGCITVLHNTRLTVEELTYQVKDSDSKIIITDEEKCSLLQEPWNHSFVYSFSTIDNTVKYEEVPIQHEFNLSDTDTIMYTSGTTGFPKGVKQTYGNHYWSATASALNLGIREDDCWLIAVPLFHISGLSILMRGVIYGMEVVLHTKFDPKKVNKAIRSEKVTIISVVTTMLSKLVDELGEESYPTSFRCMLAGGGPVPLSMLERCHEKNIPVVQTYGMTETCSQIVTLSATDAISKVGSSGKALFPCQLKIVVDGVEQGPNSPGEIVVKGPNVTTGYLHRASFEDGWLYTGDIGYLDDEGFLYVLDRRSDLIISGGENIYPAEIESVLQSHPDVIDSGVTGVEDEKWGEVPNAFVVLKSGAKTTKEDIMNFLYDRLAKYKIPKRIMFVDTLPRNATNKLQRRKLKDLLHQNGAN
ncbi:MULTISPECIES: o-succinylbenzoate--CoA ligase [Sutcliffiella]|uniref:2-succinylbenzoate--CoA ligase n=1 Tax=Sutcliffiella cohnii TaxID=33932 RepID=A0A223KU08_9BACI|nr:MULTISPECIES: o-succinylbenzoate--CoA ligase [Sutcliffiella]AST92969.1 o-succinylbenzoate--CoA ligase [Sutcliffiella cohnii]WBL14234.1 o-succinylbenzoate--CoA ligase [Sutcliffiella sp. NC1]